MSWAQSSDDIALPFPLPFPLMAPLRVGYGNQSLTRLICHAHTYTACIITVPEHFASPLLQLALTDSSIELVPHPSGTGQAIELLNNDKIDISIALTECLSHHSTLSFLPLYLAHQYCHSPSPALIAGIAQGKARCNIIGTYVTSPLNWAIVVAPNSPYQSLADLQGKPIGISRQGSGSQVMASVRVCRPLVRRCRC